MKMLKTTEPERRAGWLQASEKTQRDAFKRDEGATLSADKNRTAKERDPEGKTVTHARGVFVQQVVFLTVNHRGPLPLREVHSTVETIVRRDPWCKTRLKTKHSEQMKEP